MTHKLQSLLGNDHPLFVKNIYDLEQATGGAGIDTRLIADITEKAHAVMRKLGLDPADTTAKELYKLLEAAVVSGTAENLLVGTPYVLLDIDHELVSFNLQDVIENFHHELIYEQRQYGHAQRRLRMEIVKRYAAHERTDGAVVKTLASQVGLHHEADHDYPLLPARTSPKVVINDLAPRMLAIGDIFTDAFIKLEEHEAAVFKDESGKAHLIMPFGSKPPYERVDIIQAVGPSPNAAVAFARLGLKTSLMAYLGDDQPGKDSLDYLHAELIDTAAVSVQNGMKSNYYYVLRYGADRTILVKNEAYNYAWQEPSTVPDWIYLSLISKDSWPLHEKLLAYLEVHPDTKLAFQPGTFHFEWGSTKLAAVYKRSHIVVMNREEAVDVTGKSYDSLSDLTSALHQLGPKIVVITDGPNGSYASYDDKLVTIPNYPDPAPPYDRTGAGDAFASTIVAALAQDETIETALSWAPINSMSVVQKLGAQAGLLRPSDIQTYLKDAPAEYKVTEYIA